MKQGEFIAWLEGYVAAGAYKRPTQGHWRQIVRNLKLMTAERREREAQARQDFFALSGNGPIISKWLPVGSVDTISKDS